MGLKTKISWTDSTWNPTTGCSHASAGCVHCYAETLSLRRGWSLKPWTAQNAKENVILHPERLKMVDKFPPGSRIFVNSMSDLFHEQVPDSFIADVFAAMCSRPDLIFQILTKRMKRASTWPGPWPTHIHMGTSVEDERVKYRVAELRRCGAAVRFLSVEPMIGPLDLDGELSERCTLCGGLGDLPFHLINGELVPYNAAEILMAVNPPMGAPVTPYFYSQACEACQGEGVIPVIHQVLVGGESGPDWRQMDHAWARAIRDSCHSQGAAFFFKQSAAPRTEMGTSLIEPCTACRGTGENLDEHEWDEAKGIWICSACAGKGYGRTIWHQHPGTFTESLCSDCGGSGLAFDGVWTQECAACRGKGRRYTYTPGVTGIPEADPLDWPMYYTPGNMSGKATRTMP